jgi:hypothetical protein
MSTTTLAAALELRRFSGKGARRAGFAANLQPALHTQLQQ